MSIPAMNPIKRQCGVAAVEFAILIIPLMLMLFGLAEYGRAIYQYNTLIKATRDAARYLSTVAPGSKWDEARCLVRYGNTACDGPELVTGLGKDAKDPVEVVICDKTNSGTGGDPKCPEPRTLVSTGGTGSGVVNLVTVSIREFEFKSLINFPLSGLRIGAPDITFGDISSTMRQAT